jgi:hypothetical protein
MVEERNQGNSGKTVLQVARLNFRKEHFLKNVQRSDGGRIVASASSLNIAAKTRGSPSEGYISENGTDIIQVHSF